MNNVTPYSLEAEQSVLGGLMLDNSHWAAISNILTVDDFYDAKNRLLFEEIAKVASNREPFDMLRISEKLKDAGRLQSAGGDYYIFSIAHNTPSLVNTPEYAKIVKAKSLERETLRCLEEFKQHPSHQNIGTIIAQLKKVEEKSLPSTSPLPISLEHPSLPELPTNILQSWFGEMIEAVTVFTETPRELVLMVGLAVLAACCQKKFVIEVEDSYIEQLNLWTFTILESGNRKTAVTKQMTNPLIEWERTKAEELKPRIVEAKSVRETIEKKIYFLRKQAAAVDSALESDKLQNDIIQLEKSMPKVPVVPRLWTQDVTPEKVGLLLAENQERLAIISAEGGIIETIAGRYSNNVPNLDIFLQAYSGDAVRIDRAGRDPVFMDSPTLTFCLSAQPDILRALNSKKEFRGRGLLARFLFALPKSMIGRRSLESKPIAEATRNKYHQAIHRLLDINSLQPLVLKFSPDAYKEWKQFALSIEKQSCDGAKFEHARDLAGKLSGTAAKIAALLHCVNFAEMIYASNEISVETTKTALMIATIFAEHSITAFNLMGMDQNMVGAMIIWNWIEKERRKQFTARDCFNTLKSTFKRMEILQQALDVLLERNYIAKEESQPRVPAVGRPPSQNFTVNVYLTKNW